MDILDALNDLMIELQAEAASEFAAADRHKDEAFGLTSERLRGRGEGIDYTHEKLRKLLAVEPEPAEATAEMAEVDPVDVEPEPDVTDDDIRDAWLEHARDEHKVSAKALEWLREFHSLAALEGGHASSHEQDQRRRVKRLADHGPGDIHGRVTARAVELARERAAKPQEVRS